MLFVFKYPCSADWLVIARAYVNDILKRDCINLTRFECDSNKWNKGNLANLKGVAELGLLIEQPSEVELNNLIEYAQSKGFTIEQIEFDNYHECYRVVESATSIK